MYICLCGCVVPPKMCGAMRLAGEFRVEAQQTVQRRLQPCNTHVNGERVRMVHTYGGEVVGVRTSLSREENVGHGTRHGARQRQCMAMAWCRTLSSLD